MQELPKTIARNIEHFTGRTWLLPILSKWFERNDERMFILTGRPGTGRSMIMAWLAGAGPTPAETDGRRQLEQLRACGKAVHFCVAASGTTDLKEVARQIANQLTRNVPGFGKTLVATLGDQVQIATERHGGHVEKGTSVTGVYIANLNLAGLSEEPSFNRILRDPLKRLYEDGYNEPMLLLVDALDEALPYTGETNIVHLLAKLTDLPEKARIPTTTRFDPRVLKYFQSFEHFDLIKDGPTSVADIYLCTCEQFAFAMGARDEQRNLLAKRISEAAKGSFLYAYVVINDLLKWLSEIPDLATLALPEKLEGLYHNFLTQQLGRDEDRWYNIFKTYIADCTRCFTGHEQVFYAG